MDAEKKVKIEDLTRFAMDFVRDAGQEALGFYGKGARDVKFDEALVTEAELHLNRLFKDRLHADFPEHQIFRDEEEKGEYSHDEKRYMWLMDPLDGAANFQTGIPIWGISLALFENFWPIFGVFHMPCTGVFFTGQAGSGAFRNDAKIAISPQETIDNESLLLTYSRFHHHFRANFPGKIRNLGCTAAHICYVAMGSAEAAVISNESYRDLAAAWIIVQAAGGKIYKMDGGEFIMGENLGGQKAGDRFLVVSPEIHSQVRRCLESIPG